MIALAVPLSFAPITRADAIADVVAVTVSVSLFAGACLAFVWLCTRKNDGGRG